MEYGFLDTTGDDIEQLQNDWRAYVEAVVRAVLTYIGENGGTSSANTYTVKSGDSLWSIAKKYNVSVDELKRLNNLTTNTLRIGQILKIPGVSEPSGNNVYIVKSGDSLWSIAQKYNTTINALMQANNLTSSVLQVGERLIIPTSPNTGEGTNTYTVKSGDSLYTIANKYNTTVSALMNYNNLTSNLLQIGQVLRIPSTGTETITYVVKNGDSLWKIANQYNTTVASIKQKNGLTSDNLMIGQILVI